MWPAMIFILGFALAILIGISLGLIGSGGSILAVPTLIYVMGITPKSAIAMSLMIVGCVSLIGMIPYWRQGKISFQTVALFTPTAMIGAFLGAQLIRFPFITETVQLVTFAVIMFSASFFMIRKCRSATVASMAFQEKKQHWLIPLTGFGVGILTGFVGIGGGFLMIPALVVISQLPMKEAVGSSLLMIFFNSVAGFIGYLGQVQLDWFILSWFTAFAILGVIVGSYSSHYIAGEKLQKGFGYFLIAVAVLMLIKR